MIEPAWSPRERSAALRAAAKTAALGAALNGVVLAIGSVLANTPLAALVAQTVGAEWGGGRLGISWTDPQAPAPTSKEIAKRIARGVGAGFLIGALVVEALNLVHAITFVPTAFAAAPLATGLLSAALTAVRDQVLGNGVVLRVLSRVESKWPRVLACAAIFGAHAFASETLTLHEVLAKAALGALTGTLWITRKSSFVPVALHAGFLFAMETIFRGGFVDMQVNVAASALVSGGDAGPEGGLVAAAFLLGASFFAVPRRRG